MFYLNGKSYTRKKFSDLLIQKGLTKRYEKMNRCFKTETSVNKLPELYLTPSGYVYAVIK